MLIRAALIPVAALAAATGSCAVQRHGPDQAVFCALGKSVEGYDIYCPKPVLNGGWPAPYLVDRPGISVEDRLGWPEDDFRIWPYAADVAFYWLILLGIRATRRAWVRRGSGAGAVDPDDAQNR